MNYYTTTVISILYLFFLHFCYLGAVNWVTSSSVLVVSVGVGEPEKASEPSSTPATYSPIAHNQWTQVGTGQTPVGASHLRAILFNACHKLGVTRSLPFCMMAKCKLIIWLHSKR